MTCDAARERFSEWLDDALDPGARAALDAHLAGCPECAREFDRFRRSVALLARVERPRAPAGFVDRVMAVVQARREPWHRRLVRRLLFPLPVKLPLHAAATLVLAVLALQLLDRSPELEQATRRDAARDVGPGAPAVPAPAPDPPSAPALRALDAGPTAPSGAGEPRQSARPGPAPPLRERAREAPEPAGAGRLETIRAEPAPAPSRPAEQARAAPGRDAAADVQAREAPPLPPARERPARSERLLAAPAPPAAAPLLRGPDVHGSLVVADAPAALAELDRLAAEVGAARIARRDEGDATVVQLVVPRSAWERLDAGLRGIGRWAPTAPGELPGQVHVSVRVLR